MEDEREMLLCEWGSVGDRPVRVDRRTGVIHGVKLLGLHSRNKRVYLPEALHHACGLYERAKVNVNHAPGHPGAVRDYRDRIGLIRHVRFVEGEGLFADFVYNPKHAIAEQLAWDAEHMPENVGLSHSVLARTRRQGDQTVVEAIVHVFSVDLVADPATTDGLFESLEAAGVDTKPLGQETSPANRPVAGQIEQGWIRTLLASFDPAEAEALCPKLVDALRRPQLEQIHKLEAEGNELRQKLARAERTLAIWRTLAEFGLPLPGSPGFDPDIVDESFLEQLYAAVDEAAVRRLVGKWAELLAKTKSPGLARVAYSRATPPFTSGEDELRRFVRAICR